MAKIISSLDEASAAVAKTSKDPNPLPFPLILVPAGQGDHTHVFWVVTTHEELTRAFPEAQERSYTAEVVVSSRHGFAGEYWRHFRTPEGNEPLPEAHGD